MNGLFTGLFGVLAQNATRAGANPPMAPALSAPATVSGGRVSTQVTIGDRASV
ncbi:MAG: hypothetical protein AAGA42_05540 [Actinomycetota bacterium]